VKALPVKQQLNASTRDAAPVDRSVRVSVSRLSKRYDRRMVLRSIDFDLYDGERAALLGANGAGKTTLMRVLSTLSRPTSGTVRVGGVSIAESALQVRRQVGVVAHQPYLYDDLTAEENLRFFGRMYDVSDERDRIAEVLELVGLFGRRRDRVRTFSRGMQQRLAIARAILHRPSLLLLDEPDTGLDREGMHVLEGILAYHVAGGGTVLMATHDLRFGLSSSDRVLLLENGRIVLDAPAGDLIEEDLDARLSRR
jgi:heme ABC exporter ATP-binding subunit CcmA